MEYFCRKIAGEPVWDTLPKAEIGCFRWENGGYTPTAYANLCMGEDRFFLRLVCHEKDPTARYTVDGSPVCEDSCMEFFFRPEGDDRYLNIEMNSRGCVLSALGTCRTDRIPVSLFGERRPAAVLLPDRWELRAELPFPVLAGIYGSRTVSFLEGNFFKCGDRTPVPHYGMWSPSLTPEPDFHRPEYFGRILLAEPAVLRSR